MREIKYIRWLVARLGMNLSDAMKKAYEDTKAIKERSDLDRQGKDMPVRYERTGN